MVHELFENYGEYEYNDGGEYCYYTLKIGDYIFTTTKCGENWFDEYRVES